ncbi:tripartite tricarboxylate transporter substrate binding protein [Variovorax sp. Varisp85]|uniref:tripartite tricarboxylate transporter substrate binding protein n=1 Tax=Variovorax sp. Varisp85 TaxID=3243059 RepID=UPI0039A5F107
MTIHRRHALGALAGLVATGIAPSAASQAASYPNRPIRLVVPVTAGSVLDVIAREYGERLHAALGQPIVVDNKPGANMSIGIANAIASPADGHTLLLTTTEMVRGPLTFPYIKYDPFKEFVPLAHVASTSIFFVVPASSPARTLQEFVALSRRAPAPLSYGTIGHGSGPHFYGELIAVQTGARLADVPYKGEVPLLPDLLGGRLDAAFISGLPAAQYAKEGRIRILAAGSVSRRAASLPDVPTLAELGVAGTDIEGFIGFFVTKGTPTAVSERLATELGRIAALPAMRERMTTLGFEPRFGGTRESFLATMQGVHDGWSKANKLVSIKVE